MFSLLTSRWTGAKQGGIHTSLVGTETTSGSRAAVVGRSGLGGSRAIGVGLASLLASLGDRVHGSNGDIGAFLGVTWGSRWC